MKEHMGIRLCGTGSCVPAQTVTNDDMAKIVDTNDTWIRTRTGIENRHFADGETNLTITRKAAEQAIAMAGIAPSEIGVVVSATITGDTLVPSLACLLQRDLGLPETVFAFDVGAACTGFLFALHTARSLLCTMPEKKYALVTGSELLSRITNFADRNTCVLFGDGAGAAVICLDPETAYYFDCGAQGNTEVLYCPRNYELPNPFAKNPSEPEQQQVLSAHDLTIDLNQRTVVYLETELVLTYKEFELLSYLVRNRGSAISRDRLLEQVWGFSYEGETRTVDAHVKTLRQKLEAAGCTNLIHTVRGYGYKIGG